VVDFLGSGRRRLSFHDVGIDDVFETDWSTPAPGYINPVQEVNAYVSAIEAGITSRQTIIQEQGYYPVRIAVVCIAAAGA
jgi:capsid protein